MRMIDVVVVNYRQEENVIRLARGLAKEDIVNRVVVVDNSESENEKKKLQQLQHKQDKIKIIFSTNIGFPAACNLGAKGSKAKYLAFINPDIVYKRNILPELLNHLQKNKAEAVVPAIHYQDGNLQRTTGFFPRPSVRIWRWLFLLPQKSTTRIEWVTGAFLLIKRTVFEKINGFDERFFLYFEDIDLCYRLKQRGKKIIYVPAIKVTHKAHQSVRQVANDTVRHWYQQSWYRFVRKWRGKLIACFFSLVYLR